MRIRSNTYQKVSHQIANYIHKKANDSINGEHFILGLATGSTPHQIYEELKSMDIDFSRTITFNLDEYVGLNENHPQSYKYFMNKGLFKSQNFHSNNFPDEKLYPYYDSMIDNVGGIDIQILGIGTNGHIAFNEPETPRDSKTRIVDLTENTIKDNSRFFDSIDEVPTQAMTMGINTIMKSKAIYLIAQGKHKKEILERAVYGEITPEVPASFLQEHPNCEVFYSD
jgi:glucosamine-6-phosphate deaminase